MVDRILRFIAFGLLMVATVASYSEAATAIEGFFPGTDGVRLFYRKIGTGKDTIVYLHGGPGSNFRGNGTELEGLAQSRTLILYDQRGSGRSELVSDPKSLTASHHVRDLEALRHHFGINRFSLAGLSWGSGLAVLYAAEHPERVERLLLLSPMSPTKTLSEQRRVALNAVRGASANARFKQIAEQVARATDPETVALCREAVEIAFRAYLARPTAEALGKAAARCDIPPAAIRNRVVVEAATLESLGDWDFRPLLGRLQAPTLVMEGSETAVPLEATREWASTMPRARLLLLPRAGHEFFLDEPQAFVRAADEFLGGRYPEEAEVIRPR